MWTEHSCSLKTALLAVLVSETYAAHARPALYWEQAEHSFLYAEYLDFQGSELEGTAKDEIGGQRSYLAGQYHSPPGGWSVGGSHEYNALDIQLPGTQPQTNGDLHTLSLSAGLEMELGNGRLQFSLAPAVSASSNVMKDPGELDSDALQWWGAALWHRPEASFGWVLGLAHDYRFGEAQAYPVAGFQWRAGRNQLRVTYPDILARLAAGEYWELEFSHSPDGNEWQAYDSDKDSHDDFRREAWQSELRLSYRFGSSFRLGISAGYHWNQEWRMRLEDGSVLRPDAEDSAFMGLHLGWYPAAP